MYNYQSVFQKHVDISMQLHACIALRSCHAVHMRTDCDMMCKSPAYKTIQFLLYAMRQTKQTQGDQIMRQLLTQLTSDVDDCV